ncbi:MAG: hypothetical protein ABW076_18380 [Candidatus Thiodiazotropha sp.]
MNPAIRGQTSPCSEAHEHHTSQPGKLDTYSTILICSSGLHDCDNDDSNDHQFIYGVSSGEPLQDSVILWTRFKPNNASQTILS